MRNDLISQFRAPKGKPELLAFPFGEGAATAADEVVIPFTEVTMSNILYPIWKGNYCYRESVFPVAEADGTVKDIALLYPAVEITEVVSVDLQTRFTEGRDYVLEGGCLRIPAGSSIPVMERSEYYLTEDRPGKCFSMPEGRGYITFPGTAELYQHQIYVSYRHGGTFPGEIPQDKHRLFPRTNALLKEGKPLTIVFYGDSITVGWDCSANHGLPPFQSDYCRLFTDALTEQYGSPVNFVRTAVSGTTSVWGEKEAEERVAKYKPDLLVLAFGMNEGGKSSEEYREHISAIIEKSRKGNPETEVLLVSTMWANAEAKSVWFDQPRFEPFLLTLEQPGIAVAPMSSVHGALLTRKNYRDTTGNNVNHPNDYLHRVYAMTLLKTLCGME